MTHHRAVRTATMLAATGFAAVLITGTARAFAPAAEPVLIAAAGLLALTTIAGVVHIASRQHTAPSSPELAKHLGQLVRRSGVLEDQAVTDASTQSAARGLARSVMQTGRDRALPPSPTVLHQHLHLHGVTPDTLTTRAVEPVERSEQ